MGRIILAPAKVEQVAKLQDRVTNLETNLQIVEETAGTAKKLASQNAKNIDTLKEQVDGNTSDIEVVKSSITELETNVNANALSIASLQTYVTQSQEDIKKSQEDIKKLQEDVLKLEVLSSPYLICQDIRTEDSATITLTTDAPITELKEGMIISFTPKFNSQAGVKIKINDLEEVETYRMGYMSVCASNSPYKLEYYGGKFRFFNDEAPLRGLQDDTPSIDLNKVLTTAYFAYSKMDNIPSDIDKTLLKAFSSKFYVNNGSFLEHSIATRGDIFENNTVYRRNVTLNDDGTVDFSDWVKNSGDITGRLLK